MNLYPKPESRRRPRRAAALLAGGALLLAGCADHSSENQDPKKADTSAAATRKPTISATSREASPSASPQNTRQESLRSIGVMVCDGLFTQEVKKDGFLVVGRPAVDQQGYPLDVEVNDHGLQATPLPHEKGTIQWYDMDGKPQAASDINCKPAHVYEREVTTQPHDQKMWVASDSQTSKLPKPHWDFNALQPDGFGGVSLDYANADNLMTGFNVGEITTQAQRDAARQ